MRRTRACGKRARAPEGRRRRKTGAEVRSGKNAIIKAGRREGRRRVRAPKRGKGRRMSKVRGNRSVQDAIALDCWGSRVLNNKYHFLAVLANSTWSVCEDVNSCKNRGWLWASIGKGKRDGGLSTNVLKQGMTVSAVVAACKKRLLFQHSERGKYFHTNPPAPVGDLIFNTNPQ